MSRENVKVVCDAIAAFNRTGLESALAYFDRDASWYAPPEWPEDRLYEGHDGLKRVESVWTENFDEFRLDVEKTIDAGEHIVALLYQRGRIKGSSSHLEHPVAWDVEVRGGKIARVHTYFSWEEGLQAVGVEE